MSGPAVRLRDLRHTYGRRQALDGLSLDIPPGCMVGLVGPDGVGKSTLLALIAGAKALQDGGVEVLGGDIAQKSWRNAICPRIAYMPQGLGKNLYPDLTVEENISFFSRLYGQSPAEGAARIAGLMRDIGLAPFASRACHQLSGGMKQKLGLCCALIHDPDLLILDEPTTGVDPLSRRQFWELVDDMRRRYAGAAGLSQSDRQQMSVIVATAYMEEAERFDFLIVMNDGRILATGAPRDIRTATGAENIEQAFVALTEGGARPKLVIPPRHDDGGAPVISARGLTKNFGAFTAVDHVDLDIGRGEIFGFLGSNGCGKTTTMKMLTGLLEASSGEALLFGKSVEAGGVEARRRVGYMSQGFSLYSELTVQQNLDLHARLFALAAAEAKARIAGLLQRFELEAHRDALASDLPLGLRQRLSLAVALVHGPDLLILDEPTSGVDPVARDAFWALLIELSRDQGVTIFMSTHFMNEAARCDRISLMDSGKVLATGAPAQLVGAQGAANLEEAFIRYLEKAGAAREKQPEAAQPTPVSAAPLKNPAFSLRRLFAYTIREMLELSRDPIRLSYAIFGPAILLLVLGFGITTDVDSLTFAALDRDNSFLSRAYLSEVRGSAYFVEKEPIRDSHDLETRLKSGKVTVTIEIPPNFGRDVKKGESTEVSVWIDGAMPFRAETIHGYLTAAHQQFLNDPAIRGMEAAPPAPVNIETRFRYNQDFDSIYAMVPGSIALQLALIPAILMALAIVREKELGSITNLYVTPVTRLEFLLGKQLPYIALAFADFFIMFLMALYIFHVPLKGGFGILALGTLVYVAASTGYGMLISAFTNTQIAALFGTAILTILPASMFSGMSTPAASITGFGRVLGALFPMTYYLPICVGAFTKGLFAEDLLGHLVKLSLFVPALVFLSLLMLRKQEK